MKLTITKVLMPRGYERFPRYCATIKRRDFKAWWAEQHHFEGYGSRPISALLRAIRHLLMVI